ncbi:hypothetical protein L209DRAFT_215203 [Thermothelomyces heterothallicus CBS 203.75]
MQLARDLHSVAPTGTLRPRILLWEHPGFLWNNSTAVSEKPLHARAVRKMGFSFCSMFSPSPGPLRVHGQRHGMSGHATCALLVSDAQHTRGLAPMWHSATHPAQALEASTVPARLRHRICTVCLYTYGVYSTTTVRMLYRSGQVLLVGLRNRCHLRSTRKNTRMVLAMGFLV